MTDAQQQAAQQELAKLQGSIQGGLQAQEITARKELQTMMSNTQISLQDKAALQQTAVTKMELLSRAELQQAQNSTTLSVADKQAAQSKYNSDLDANIRLSIQGIDNAFKTTYQTADVAAKTALLTLENETKLTLADMESTYKNAMQTSASATTMFQTGMNMIQNAVADSTINAADKTKLINGYLGWMKEGINVAGNISHVDTSWLLSGTFAAVT